ncbi:sugar transferase [Pelobium manganitolerans]|uniref:Sugar transferase n=1 Tax=Pelobium manganitolerans TaxID=1842495 RepID=A0A419SBJ7_9SPHI|nr:glycosyltransferase [Pelobium manganitolerans]RKD20178.1 sugar transferase [Pelobium manganitolerans]
MNAPAPIALFVYNRPYHTQKTVESLQANHLAKDSDLFIFADGAKAEKDQKAVQQVADYIATVDGFKSVTIVKQHKNLGLASSIIKGVTYLSDNFGKFLVFEDDLVCSPHTLSYLNDALQRYEDDERVYHICASMHPLKVTEAMPQTFFYRTPHSCGWASWKRAWDKFNPDIDDLMSQFDAQKINDFTFDGKMNFWKQMNAFKAGKNSSWAIRWYASVFLNKGLALNVTHSLIQNIGHDGSGVHSDVESTYDVEIYPHPITQYPTEVAENQMMYRAVRQFYATRKGNLWQRGVKFLRKMLKAS